MNDGSGLIRHGDGCEGMVRCRRFAIELSAHPSIRGDWSMLAHSTLALVGVPMYTTHPSVGDEGEAMIDFFDPNDDYIFRMYEWQAWEIVLSHLNRDL